MTSQHFVSMGAAVHAVILISLLLSCSLSVASPGSRHTSSNTSNSILGDRLLKDKNILGDANHENANGIKDQTGSHNAEEEVNASETDDVDESVRYDEAEANVMSHERPSHSEDGMINDSEDMSDERATDSDDGMINDLEDLSDESATNSDEGMINDSEDMPDENVAHGVEGMINDFGLPDSDGFGEEKKDHKEEKEEKKDHKEEKEEEEEEEEEEEDKALADDMPDESATHSVEGMINDSEDFSDETATDSDEGMINDSEDMPDENVAHDVEGMINDCRLPDSDGFGEEKEDHKEEEDEEDEEEEDDKALADDMSDESGTHSVEGLINDFGLPETDDFGDVEEDEEEDDDDDEALADDMPDENVAYGVEGMINDSENSDVEVAVNGENDKAEAHVRSADPASHSLEGMIHDSVIHDVEEGNRIVKQEAPHLLYKVGARDRHNEITDVGNAGVNVCHVYSSFVVIILYLTFF